MYEDLKLPTRLRDLLNNFRELVFVLRQHRRDIWKRIDPSAELFFDRQEKSLPLGYPASVTIYDSVFLCGNVQLGENVFVGQFCQLDGSGDLIIGEGTTIATGAKILTHDSIDKTLSGGRLPVVYAKVIIEDHCFIGANAIVTKGCHIHSHAIVGAGSIVKHDIPAYSIAAGMPAKVIGHINPQTLERNYIK